MSPATDIIHIDIDIDIIYIMIVEYLLRDAVRRDNCFRTERRYYAHLNILLRTSRASTGKFAE